MSRLLRNILLATVCGGLTYCASAFSLIGPRATTWQTDTMAYNLNNSLSANFGPMNIGEEYRLNVPVVFYGFSADFLNYFGERGAQEVDKAVKMINDLPPVSRLNVADYPLGSMRINHRAQALLLTDLKSYALRYMLYEMGADDPTRWVFTLRNWRIPDGATCPTVIFFVTQRNFDPTAPYQYSPYINGDLWTYTILITCTPTQRFFCYSQPVDPMALLGFRHAPATSLSANLGLSGSFFPALTRDDVGALKYLYRSDNYNVETVPAGAAGGTNVVVQGTTIGGGGATPESPWQPPPGLTNAFTAGLTNINVGPVAPTNSFADPALRGGLDKVYWVRADFDSILGVFFTPMTNQYNEAVIINGQRVSQGVQRALLVPDVVFDAADLQDGETPDPFGPYISGTTAITWVNITTTAPNWIGGAKDGPGTVSPTAGSAPGLILTLNKVGPLWQNTGPFFVSEADAAENDLGIGTLGILWGSFDGSTNAPVIYPDGTSIEDIERLVFGGR